MVREGAASEFRRITYEEQQEYIRQLADLSDSKSDVDEGQVDAEFIPQAAQHESSDVEDVFEDSENRIELEDENSTYNAENPENPAKVWKSLTPEEFEAYLGIITTAGVHHSKSKPTVDLWKTYANPLYRAIMGLTRFWSISRFLRFDNANNRADRLATDKAAAITDIYNLLNANLRSSYSRSDRLTVDE
ncbi:hypothetical protein ILUMI_06559 [Ignelater luminosus]|uniref:PiggyBac transposable element-derived protein domain-containing protein n=1 Tax=Ignelater luminosus TaxID=2038154 RepID=A0A8K0D562_IGNLU|nr:hypothetical protein ILUMI_06559 [Ignelater luminosus]